MKRNSRDIRTIAKSSILIALVASATGCLEPKLIGSTASLASTAPGSSACDATISGGLRVRDGSGPAARTIDMAVFTDTLFSPSYRVAEVDGCGGFIADVSAATWSVAGSGGAIVLGNTSGGTASIRLLGGASSKSFEVNVSATASGGRTLSGKMRAVSQSTTTVRKLAGLVRWYSASQYYGLPAGGSVGVSGVSQWMDWGSSSTAYDAAAMASGREPFVDTEALAPQVGLKFCGKNAGCTSANGAVTTSAAMRFAPSYAEFAGSDLTVIALVRRRTTAVTHVVSNQSSGNQSGIFMGYTGNTLFEFSLKGPGGVPAVSSVIPGYTAPGLMELWTGRVDTQANSGNPGMQLYRNGAMVASNPNIVTNLQTATTIPLLGTYRSENDSGAFVLGEYIQFSRGLSDGELCQVHQYLNQKFALGLNLGC